MSDEKKSLNDWGIDVDRFKERAKESLESAKGDLSEITGTLRQTLVHAKDVVMGMQGPGSPAAAELKAGFERAWKEIEGAFRAAREKAKEGRSGVAEAETSVTVEPSEAEPTPEQPPNDIDSPT
jgi:hypothetical protein